MNESLGMRIKLARTRRGLNQAQLARQISISKNSMNLIERDLSQSAFVCRRSPRNSMSASTIRRRR